MGHKRSSNLLCSQVFLSHSGKQKNFARHLFKEMERHNISCFFDEESLRIGEEFPDLIFEAALNCNVAVVVLSDEFISTKWPMQELCAFVKAQNTSNTSLKILPLFFAMSPDALAQKVYTNDFLKSWQELQTSQRRSINFDEWIKALEIVRKTNGIVYIENKGEVAYIDKIIAEIQDMLPPRLIYDESDVQGKERLCQEVAKLFDKTPCLENGVRIAGLYGVGGIGKTTIAKIVCNFYSKDFDGRVLHVELGKEKPKKTLKRALRILCGASQSLVNRVMIMEEGWYMLKEMMNDKSVFLALDNISDRPECTEEVLMYLKAVCHRNGNRSMILLTARSLPILEQFIQEGDKSCMPVPFLQEEEAIAVLLKLDPLKLSNLTIEQKDIARKCVQNCCFSGQYHPLVLKIFGKSLRGNIQHSWADPFRWIDVLNISRRDQMQEVFSRFKGSFMSLSVQHRKIFMLLSLYLPHSYMTLEKVFNWLAVVCSQEAGDIESAINELREKGFIEGTKQSRDRLDIHDLLIAFAGNEADGTGKWISLKGKDEIPSCLQESVSNDRPKFWAMKLENCHFESPGMMNNELFTDILVLHLSDMRTVKILDLSSMKMLRSISIIGCSALEEIRGLQSLSSLAYCVIRDCPADIRFCPEIQCPRALRHLEVRANLQNTMLRSLQGPRSLFPPLQDMIKLETRRLDHSEKGPGPLHLAGYSKLQTIELCRCDITQLDLTGCWELRTIDVHRCNDLSEIRLSSGGCSTANLLLMPGCANFDSVPLERTSGGLREFPRLGGLPNNLTSLTLRGMGSLRELPSLTGLLNLSHLKLGGMDMLMELPTLSGLPNLSFLALVGMGRLRELPSLSGLPNLSSLILVGMGSLRELPSLSGLPNLINLVLYGMDSLKELPSLSGLPKLINLILYGMDSLRELPSLSGLRSVGLWSMSRLRELPSLSGLRNLESLGFGDMGSLTELPNLSGLPNLSFVLLSHLSKLSNYFVYSGVPYNLFVPKFEDTGLSSMELPCMLGLPNLTDFGLANVTNFRLADVDPFVLCGGDDLRTLPERSILAKFEMTEGEKALLTASQKRLKRLSTKIDNMLYFISRLLPKLENKLARKRLLIKLKTKMDNKLEEIAMYIFHIIQSDNMIHFCERKSMLLQILFCKRKLMLLETVISSAESLEYLDTRNMTEFLNILRVPVEFLI